MKLDLEALEAELDEARGLGAMAGGVFKAGGWALFYGSTLIARVRELTDALEAAERALVDLGACDDPKCKEPNCLRALPQARAALAKP